MFRQLKLTASEVLANPSARTALILGLVVAAALVGGAPYDFGGG
jgi:hypothetical protein